MLMPLRSWRLRRLPVPGFRVVEILIRRILLPQLRLRGLTPRLFLAMIFFMRRQAWRHVLLSGLALMLNSFIRLQAETVTLTSSADTSLFETTPEGNMGGNPTVAAGTTYADMRSRALYRFDFFEKIPTNATILSVNLTLYVTFAPAGDIDSFFELHRMLKDWIEGNKTGSRGQTAAAGQVTWNAQFAPNVLWDAPGAASGTDFSAPVSAVSEKVVGGPGPYHFNSTRI